MKAIIKLDISEFQIGQEVSVYFPDTMRKTSITEVETDIIEELRKLWLQIYNIDEPNHDFEGFYYCQNEALELITKRIEELKGENK